MVYYSVTGAKCGTLGVTADVQLHGTLTKVSGWSPCYLVRVVLVEEVAAPVHQIEVVTRPQGHEAEHKDWHCTETLLLSVCVAEDYHSLCRIWSFHRGGYEEFCILGCNGVHSVICQKTELLIRNLLLTVCVTDNYQKYCCLLRITRNIVEEYCLLRCNTV
jgi:hypothetical protein